MTTVARPHPLSPSSYLEEEASAPCKREFVDGFVYAMVGASNLHNRVATNVTGMLYAQLRGKPCRVYNSDTKVRVRRDAATRFYYPDASVVCRSNPPGDSFQDEPVIVIEVLSESTRRIDELEKKDAYLTIPSLHAYVLLESARQRALVWRRGDQGVQLESYDGAGATIPLPEVGCALLLGEVYEGTDRPSLGIVADATAADWAAGT